MYFYYYRFMAITEQPVLAGTPVKNWRILLEQSFTARMPLLTRDAESLFFCGTPTPTPSPNFRLRLQDVMCNILIVYFRMNGEKM